MKVMRGKSKRTVVQEVDGVLVKKCPKCDQWRPLTEEYWVWQHSAGKLAGYCKVCSPRQEVVPRSKKDIETGHMSNNKWMYTRIRSGKSRETIRCNGCGWRIYYEEKEAWTARGNGWLCEYCVMGNRQEA